MDEFLYSEDKTILRETLEEFGVVPEIRQGGLMRCCIATIQDYDADTELDEEFIMDCKYEESGNRRILYKDGVWQWNPALYEGGGER